MLLITTTKNDESSIRWDELALDPDDFVLHKIGWGQKAQSIEEAASQLELGLDSFVLVDDNDVERALVSQQLPGVTVLDSRDPRTWEALGYLLEFPNTRRTDEARRRTEMYREAAVRRDAMASAFDYPTMMAGLELQVGFWAARKPDVERLHELLQRTNQFNTTTKRLPVEELHAMVDRGEVYAASLQDKFGKLGIVGAVLVRRDGDDLVFDDVVMSCRAMGFGLEHVMLRSTMDAEAGWSRAVGLFVPSGRNGPAADLFAGAGFRSDGEGRWVIERQGALPEQPPWIALHTS
jgi:FkbH-like protein